MHPRGFLLIAIASAASCGDDTGAGGATTASGTTIASGPSATATGATGAQTSVSNASQASSASTGTAAPPRVLVFSKTAGFRHDSIEDGIAMLTAEAAARDWMLEATEDGARFTDESLAGFDVVVFLSTTGDVLDDAQQAAFEGFIQGGGGYVGIHSASDTEYDWPFYGDLVGAYFSGHPAIQPATITVEDMTHPATAHLASPAWMRTDEWYSFVESPRPDVDVLLALDESSYDPGGLAMGDHPIAWAHESLGGRAFYTALGHTRESYAEAPFVEHVSAAIAWAAQ